MKAVQFPEVNLNIGENQEQFQTLPAYADNDGVVTCCFELDKEEMQQVLETGKIYLQIKTGFKPLQPIGTSVLNPFNTNQSEQK